MGETSSLFMSREDVVKLTGFKQPSKQIKWLKQYNYNFEVNALRHPAVFINQSAQHVKVAENFEMKFAS